MKRRGPPPVQDYDDAVTFLSYWARFFGGESAANADGCLLVLMDMEETLAITQARCVELARKLEAVEARGGEGL